MLILIGCMVDKIGVEGDECNGLGFLGGKQGYYSSFCDSFSTSLPQNKALQVFL